jgi:hypothetical protein
MIFTRMKGLLSEHVYQGFVISIYRKALLSVRPYQGRIRRQDGRTRRDARSESAFEAADEGGVLHAAKRHIDRLN